jgi:hypothetical protein
LGENEGIHTPRCLRLRQKHARGALARCHLRAGATAASAAALLRRTEHARTQPTRLLRPLHPSRATCAASFPDLSPCGLPPLRLLALRGPPVKARHSVRLRRP